MEFWEDVLLGVALLAGAFFTWWIFSYRRKKINNNVAPSEDEN